MTNEEQAGAFRAIAEWVLENSEIEPQARVRLSKMIRGKADELDPPCPEPGMIVWWRYPHVRNWQIAKVHQAGDQLPGIYNLRGVFVTMSDVQWEPARIPGPMQEIVDIPPTREWPLTATAIQMFYVDSNRRFLSPVGAIGRVVTREEMVCKEEEL